jgi:outer membrane protein assembly factor BamB
VKRFLASALAITSAIGCANTYRLDTTPREYEPAEAVLRQLWSRPLTNQPLLDYKPQELASPAIDGNGTIYVGARSGRFVALDRRGRLRWQQRAGGAISSKPLLDETGGTVYYGADDGKLYAVEAASGEVRWSYATQGTISPAPTHTDGLLLFTSSEGRVYGLEAHSGKWRWQYERESPEGFTIHGYAGVLVHEGLAYTGFSDGMLVALKPATGEVVWTRYLGGDAERFVDADATPVISAGVLLAASYAGGVFALSPDTGDVLWRTPLTGVSGLAAEPASGLVIASAAKSGVVALNRRGEQIWRQTLPRGIPSSPTIVDREYLMVSSSGSGLYIAALRTGDLVQRFAPGRGISSSPGLGSDLVAVLTNHGRLYAFTR